MMEIIFIAFIYTAFFIALQMCTGSVAVAGLITAAVLTAAFVIVCAFANKD